MSQNGNNKDHVLNTMKRYKMPLTRENYIAIAYPDGMPDDAELESALPLQFQKKTPKSFEEFKLHHRISHGNTDAH